MTLALRFVRGQRLAFLGAVLLAALALLFGVGLNATGGALLTRAAQHPPTLLSLTLLITAVRAFGIGRAALRYAERLVAHGLSLRLLARTRAALYTGLLPLGRELLVRERAGVLLNAAGPDVDTLQDAYLRVLSPTVAFGIVTAVACGLLTLLSPVLALVVLCLLLLAALIPFALFPVYAHWIRRRDLARTRLSADLLEGLAARADLGHMETGHDGTDRELESTDRALVRLASVSTLMRELCAACALLAAVFLLPGQGSAPLLVAATLGVLTAFEGAAPLANLPAALLNLRAASQRLEALLALELKVQTPAEPTPVPGEASYHLSGVCVQLGGRRLLSGLNLDLPAGSRTAIIGESGAGKSTLLRLLTRDLDPAQGTVSRGGVPLSRLEGGEHLRRVSLLDQDAALLDATLRENLLLADPDLPDARLRDLLARLGLKDVPLDLWAGEGGVRLSGGERQRLALARALLKPSDTLILDEPTAHLDEESERLAVQVIHEELAGRTLILASHRAAPLTLADRVLRLDAGELGLHP